MDADVAGLDDDDNPALEGVDATADESTEEKWPGGPSSRVPRTQRLRRLRLVQGRRREDSSEAQATIGCVKRASSQCDQFSSKHAGPWKAERTS